MNHKIPKSFFKKGVIKTRLENSKIGMSDRSILIFESLGYKINEEQ